MRQTQNTFSDHFLLPLQYLYNIPSNSSTISYSKGTKEDFFLAQSFVRKEHKRTNIKTVREYTRSTYNIVHNGLKEFSSMDIVPQFGLTSWVAIDKNRVSVQSARLPGKHLHREREQNHIENITSHNHHHHNIH